MPQPANRWLKLTFTTPGEALEQCEHSLWASGALSITVLDQADAPVYEPPAGATPCWPLCRVEALFAADTDYAVLVELLAGELDAARDVAVSGVADCDWVQHWHDSVSELRFGERLQILPHDREPASDDLVSIALAPGLAFGSGSHATTRLCLEWLCTRTLPGHTLLDYGCGSGVLAIAALRLGAASAHAVDIDPQALQATRENAARNQVAARLRVAAPPYAPAHAVDFLVANILAGPLEALAGQLAACQRRGAELALSGIFASQADAVMQAYRPWYRFAPLQHLDDWCLASARRR